MLRQPGATRFLPHAVVATLAVVVPPAAAVWFVAASGRPLIVVASVLLGIAGSVTAAIAGTALWSRRPDADDIVFADLMLWGWLRRARAERRLAEAEGVLDRGAGEGDAERLERRRRCRVLQQLAAELEAKDGYTLGHSRRVTRHCENIARELGLPSDEVARVRIAASVHDVGKARLSRAVLTKPGRLTEEEFAVVKRHAVEGAGMVTGLGDPRITAMVRHHHERLDGSGYPDGLTGDQIPLGARIIAVADTFDALTSHRPYQDSYRHRRALEVLGEEAGTRLDSEAVAAFARYYSGTKGVALSALGLATEARLAGWAGAVGGASGSAAPTSIAAVFAAALAGATLTGESSAAAERAPGPAGTTAARVTRADAAPPGMVAAPMSRAERRGLAGRVVQEGGWVVRDRAPQPDRRDTRSDEDGGGPGSTTEPVPPAPPGDPPAPAPEPPLVELPPVVLPAVEVPRVVELPAVELPAVDLPRAIDLPAVELPLALPR
jgi:hypothetical protein